MFFLNQIKRNLFYLENQQEIVQDVVKKAKQIEILIDNLPGLRNTEQEQFDMIKELNKEMQEANLEYIKAVEDAGR